MFSRIFIERPRFAFVISIVLMLAGLLAVNNLPIAEYPEISPPSILVMANYTGASATDVQDTVAMPIEAELNALEDMLYFSSNCANSGMYMCSITFKSGINDDIAMVNVQNAVKRAEAKLPTEVRQVGVNVFKRSTDILCMFSYSTDGKNMTMPELNNFAATTVKDNLSRVDGVATVDIYGAQAYSMRIWMDPLRMAGLKVSTDEIIAAVSSQNIQAAAGTVGSENASKYLEFKLNVKGRLKTTEEFGDIIVRRDEQGNLLRLRDIARIELGAKQYTSNGRFNGQDNVAIAVYRNNDANALKTVRLAKEKVAEIETRLPEGVRSQMAYDPTRFIVISMQEILTTLIVALAMVILITYLFLQDWRATLVPSIAIPVALLGTFPFMAIMDISINVLSMFGLVLVIGSLVDDAIVVVENCQSLMYREKLNAKDAAIKTMEQITGAIIATTLVTIACYVPLAFYGGMVGNIYRQFAITMCISLSLSTVVAMTLSPALCSLIMRPPAEKPHWIFAPFNKFLDFTRFIYLGCVQFLVRQAMLTLLIFAGICFGIWHFSNKVPSSFLPQEDKGAILCSAELSSGATLGRNVAALERFREALQTVPEVNNVLAIAGFSPISGEGENCAFVVVDLKDWSERTAPESQLDPVKARLEAATKDIPEIQARFFVPPAIMGLGVTGGVSCEICSDAGATPQEIAKVAWEFAGALMKNPKTAYAYSTFSANNTQLNLTIDREKAQTLGLSAKAIFAALQSQLASYYVNDFNIKGETFYVKIQSDLNFRSTLDDIRDIQIANAYGEMVPLSSIGVLNFEVGPRRIERFNKATSAQIQAQGKPGVSSSEMMKILEEIPLPAGYHLEWSGMSFQERQNQGQIIMLMALAMLFAYLFLVAQYESWTIPVPVMLTVFTALLGAFIGLWLTGEPLSIYAQLGLVMLVGLTAKNAILMVEFSKDEHENGASIVEAAVRGASLRYRAVLMTAWSFVFGVFPMVIATGAGAGSRRAIGITTFSGMLLATIVGIIITPALYAAFQRLREFGKKLLGIKPRHQIIAEERARQAAKAAAAAIKE